MKNWYLLYCQIQRFERVVQKISSLDIECYYPLETRITPRKNRTSPNVRQKALFAGYLFVHIDPEIVHPTELTNIPGAHYFVRFGGKPCVIKTEIIETLKCVRLLRLNSQDGEVEYMNLPPALLIVIQKIYGLPTLERNIEFMRLLEHPDTLSELLVDHSRVHSSLAHDSPTHINATA
ncbi:MULTISPECIES: transcription termination/antitermination NusG family protein [unclassified Serratia (in: enterobacteria)]|uniref:transcription termination/antitermination NusG family protein n=1 Tax=unclassified Serratia (in: enterobacteria) TaxID=2647522 RepID=UPI003075F612